jgi:ribose transport system permease protein
VGHDPVAARRAGLPVGRILFAVYVISGLLAALGGAVAIAQLGAVSPTFGREREFAAVAAAVLGGVSLFGGRGSVLPGVLLGAVLIQTVENGLVIVNADPYLYPIILAGVIFLAVLLDSVRARTSRAR